MSENDHGQTYGEAINELLGEIAEKLETHYEIETELEAAVADGGPGERHAAWIALTRVQSQQSQLEEMAWDLLETRQQTPFDRLSDEQRGQFMEMYLPHLPNDILAESEDDD